MSRSGQQALLAQERLELVHHGNEGHNVNRRHAPLDQKARQPHVAEIRVHREQPHSNQTWMIYVGVSPPAQRRTPG